MESRSADTDIASRTEAIVGRLKPLEGPLLPILRDIQREFGYVPQASLPVIANGLNLSRAEVHGVVSFYHDYRREPAGRHVLKICQAEACQSMGSDGVAARLSDLLGASFRIVAHRVELTQRLGGDVQLSKGVPHGAIFAVSFPDR